MSFFQNVRDFFGRVIHKMIPYKSIENTMQIQTCLTPEMQQALESWYNAYTGKAYWLQRSNGATMNLPAFVCSEISRQVVLEMKANISAKAENGNSVRTEDGEYIQNELSGFLQQEIGKCLMPIREKLEQACAAGGMIIKPYVLNGRIYFDYVMDWSMLPIAFDGAGNLQDVIFRDIYTLGNKTYTRLERHRVDGNNVEITQRCFVSTEKGMIGTECSLTEVPLWKDLQPRVIVNDVGGKQLFGWFRVAGANIVDPDSPIGVSVFAKAMSVMADADFQYGDLLWEFEGGQLAVDVDPLSLKETGKRDSKGQKIYESAKLNERLFRTLDLGEDDTYKVFSPNIREGSIINGLNEILSRVEDLTGLARGTMTDTTTEALTATQLRILRQRTYTTVSDNQKALERCLRDVIDVMAVYAKLYCGKPNDEYDVAFEWDDSIIVDKAQEANERIAMVNMGALSKAEFRQWYFGETPQQAKQAIAVIMQETMDSLISSQVANSVLGNPDMPDGVDTVVQNATNRVDTAERNANKAME